MIRAYCHFILVNMFCLHYNEATSSTDLGIPYREEPMNFFPDYDRGTVAEVYQKLERDIEEGLPLIDDSAYPNAPKYHFNRKASYAFASRFYLYYGKWDKSLEYSNLALGNDLDKILRNLQIYSTLTKDQTIWTREFINPNNPCNFLIISAMSSMGRIWGSSTTGKLYQHTRYIADNETVRSPGPWNSVGVQNDWYLASSYWSSSGYCAVYKVPYEFEYTDPVAGTGHSRSIYPAFTADEVLLNRAEVNIIKGKYDEATADLAKWMTTHTKTGVTLTRELVNQYYGNLPYYKPDAPTAKKALHPLHFTISSPEQENFLHCVLHFRRIETIFNGLRWFDIKRYGIEIVRRNVRWNASAEEFEAVTDELKLDDPRRAIQLPQDVITVGMTPNPR